MKILVAVDMEGITGVVHWDQVMPDQPDYARFRKLMVADVNAAVSGAFDGGASEVIVADGHHAGLNLPVDELDPRVRLNSGMGTAPHSMMQGIDESVDGVLFVGYHARAGSQSAVLDHTWSSKIANVWLNDVLVGEYGLNAALAGYFGVPVLMVTGDRITCEQVTELLGAVEAVPVKDGTGRYSAECLPPAVTQPAIREAARRALLRLKKGNVPEAFILDTPVVLTVEFTLTEYADRAAQIPAVQRTGLQISYTAPDMNTAYLAFRAIANLGTAG